MQECDLELINEAVYEYISQYVDPQDILKNEPMSRHTTFCVGGEAEAFLRIRNKEQLEKLIPYFKLAELPYFVIGNGSNLLVGDKGYHGIILYLGDGMDQIRVDGNRLTVQAGCLMSRIAREACEHALTGFEFASGIPGSIGGGVVMNAGAYDGELGQIVTKVWVMNEEGEILVLNNQDMEFGYRTSVIKKRPFIVVQAELELQPGNKEEIAAKMAELNRRRRDKQPLEYPSAGSTFKRPEGHFAGALIEQCGLKGVSVGGAQVSEKHAGFIINRGGATASDILSLIKHVQACVKAQTGVTLETEIRLIG